MDVSPVAKQYVTTILHLTEGGRQVIAARLAEYLGVTPPTVHQTLQRLLRDGLVEVQGRQGIRLTEAGRQIAQETLQRQRLSERWLVEVLGLGWADAQAAARAMEGAISPPIAAQLDAILGHPSDRDGDGQPIGADGTDPITVQQQPLDQCAVGDVVVLERVADDAPHARELLAALDRSGLRPGIWLTVTAVDRWAQTITVRHGHDELVLGRGAASTMWVRPTTPEEQARGGETGAECPVDGGFVAEVTSVADPCPAGHRIGDRFLFGQRTPCGLCGEAFVEMHPRLAELRQLAVMCHGASLSVACPEHGNVTFQVSLNQPPASRDNA